MAQGTHSSGRFVWHELLTANSKAATGFYGELFGWKAREEDMGGMKYTMLSAGGTDIGGIVAPPPGAPTSWLSYCTVADVDKAVRRTRELGGSVGMEAMDIPTVGRFAVIKDPVGAVLAVIRQEQEAPESDALPAPGTFCWNELLATDPRAAVAFHKDVFGWSVTEKDMGPMGVYNVLNRGDKMAAGIMKAPMAGAPSAWLSYVAVEDVDASTKRAERLAAKLILPPNDIPKIGRFSVIADPQGATLALFRGTSA
jgi:uncharacterized protein